MNVKTLASAGLLCLLVACASESDDTTSSSSNVDMTMSMGGQDTGVSPLDMGGLSPDSLTDNGSPGDSDGGEASADQGPLNVSDAGMKLPVDAGQNETSCVSEFEDEDLFGMTARSLTREATVPMCDFRGETLLFINTAANCGFTPQFEQLEALHREYAHRPLRVLGFLSNDFGNQGGSLEEVQQCTDEFMVTFEQFLHVGVTSGSRDGQHPIFDWLTTQPLSPGEIPWNFSKFLVSHEGELIGRWTHQVSPDDGGFLQAVEAAVNRAQLAQ